MSIVGVVAGFGGVGEEGVWAGRQCLDLAWIAVDDSHTWHGVIRGDAGNEGSWIRLVVVVGD